MDKPTAASLDDSIRRLRSWAKRGAQLHFENGAWLAPEDVDVVLAEIKYLRAELERVAPTPGLKWEPKP